MFAASKLLMEPKPQHDRQRNRNGVHTCMTRRCFSAATGQTPSTSPARTSSKSILLVANLNASLASEGVWAESHHDEVAKAQAEATGVDSEAIRRFVNRSTYRVVPLDAEVNNSQQAVADRFAKLGLIPKPVNVSDIVWKWTPGS